MKQAILSVSFTVGLGATYFFREALGPAFVWIVLIFVADLGLAGIYYLQLRSEETQPRGGRKEAR